MVNNHHADQQHQNQQQQQQQHVNNGEIRKSRQKKLNEIQRLRNIRQQLENQIQNQN